MDLRPKS